MQYIITLDQDRLVELIILNRQYQEQARLTFADFTTLCNWATSMGINDRLTIQNCQL